MHRHTVIASLLFATLCGIVVAAALTTKIEDEVRVGTADATHAMWAVCRTEWPTELQTEEDRAGYYTWLCDPNGTWYIIPESHKEWSKDFVEGSIITPPTDYHTWRRANVDDQQFSPLLSSQFVFKENGNVASSRYFLCRL